MSVTIHHFVLIFLKDTSQRGSDIRCFGSTTAAFITDYIITDALPKRLMSDPLWLVSFRNISMNLPSHSGLYGIIISYLKFELLLVYKEYSRNSISNTK